MRTKSCPVFALMLVLVALPALAQQRPANRPPARQAPAAITRETLPPPPPALAPPPPVLAAPPAPAPPPPQPLQRRIGLAELGHPAGFAFAAAGRELAVPLPRGLPGLAARLHLQIDLTAPFAGRQAVEVSANGRLLAGHAFPPAETRLSLDIEIPATDIARSDGPLRLTLRLIEQTGPSAATATLRADSHLALLLPEDAALSIATVYDLLPLQSRVLLRPGPVAAPEAAAALRIALALAATGREVRITSEAPPRIVQGPGGARIWATGVVAVGLGTDAASVVEAESQPALALGGPQPERAARLLEGPWRAAAASGAVSGGASEAQGAAPRLAATPPRDFAGLPAAFAAGVEVVLDRPADAEQLNPLLWVLRGLLPPEAPIAVTLAEPGTAPHPTRPFLAATREPPAGSTPGLRFDAGRISLSDRQGRGLLELGGLDQLMAVQLLHSSGQAGIWLRQLGLPPVLPATPPRLERGDIALLDGQGVALAWASGPAPQVRVAYPDVVVERSQLLVWRPWVLAVLWLAGFSLMVFAFLRPRREWQG